MSSPSHPTTTTTTTTTVTLPAAGAGAAVAAATIATDGCPVDHSKFTPEQLAQYSHLYKKKHDMNSHPPTPQPAQAPLPPAPILPPYKSQLVCDSTSLSSPLPPTTGQCPVDHSKFVRPGSSSSSVDSPPLAGPSVVGDVFPDATPQAHQRQTLSTTPVASSIPKGGADQKDDATWIFPSPQRFFNAMTKKGWNPHEPDMAWVVSIHNTVNERTWKKVMEYESMHASECSNPKLLRFRGRPSDLSPKARILSWLGYVTPFDRHDWVVDRCGKEVRYVIDFYAGAGSNMAMDIGGMPPAIHLDVRPALTPMGVIDRIRWNFNQWFNAGKR